MHVWVTKALHKNMNLAYGCMCVCLRKWWCMCVHKLIRASHIIRYTSEFK